MIYKFDEDELLEELQAYIDETYNQHYGRTKIQAIENIIDKGHGTGFCMGNIEKYFCRYGQKEGYNRRDLWKIIHYALLQLYVHDKEDLPQNVTYSNALSASCESRVYSQNVYVDMGDGKIGQEQNGMVVFIGYGKLDKRGCLVPNTFRYSTEV
jgi:hypothetical protein